MTLIIKELIIRGIVSSDHSSGGGAKSEKEELRRYMEEIKNELKEECHEIISQKLDMDTLR